MNWKYKPFMSMVDTIGSIIYCLRNRKIPKNPKKVLFIRLEHIGDMVMATPTFETFKKNNPNCEVHVLCKRLTAPILKNNPYVDKIYNYDAPWFRGKPVDKLPIKELKAEKYDVVFEMHGDPRNLALAADLKSFIVGYSCRGFGFLCNKKMPYDPKIRNIDQNLSLIKDFILPHNVGVINTTKIWKDKNINKSITNYINNYIHSKYIIINPKSGVKEKDLTDKEVFKILQTHIKTPIIITGSKDDIENNKKFEKYSNVVNLTGETTLLELIELTRLAQKVYCPDTSILHIAKAVGTPYISYYKTTDPKVWGY